ncbi:hypothetical protein FC89_GL000860 [Liquorilactobacillus ghanensis DSM 18630]|uniref:DUF5672 domain-containing protein n=1 Tax=Liquorilactobacillus ghanensis DSM 18630 TaxID=1423750 RepID=A0A0R1VWI7_9LACO|nr:DUF5672 family protein [Liquorilactobacillus ghanensis]KRM05996.1 hypothetical protein FC89_GL000860 [Liquorilactobacillus ghanensis DSM 18630]
MKKRVIGIPIYKHNLNNTEKVSLQRINQCFKNEAIVFIAPVNLEFDFTKVLSNYKVFRYPNYFFKNRRTYSQLLLSTAFYESFKEYEYLLICQLDVFVFSNRLNEFCNLNYDYIGAPMYFPFGSNVGNGGFSLRKVTSCIRMLKMRDRIYLNNPWQTSLEMMEDQFFSYCGNRPELSFKVSDIEVAVRFAIDACFEIKNEKNIPFAIHKFNFVSSPWKKRIFDLGFKLPQVATSEIQAFKRGVEQMQLCFWEYKLYQSPNLTKIKRTFKTVFPLKNVSIWGLGTNGNRCQNLFNLVGIRISCVYDNAFTYTKMIDGVLYTNFQQFGLIKGLPILITTVDYEDEISGKLIDLGLKKNQDFFLFSEIEKEVLSKYFDKQ